MVEANQPRFSAQQIADQLGVAEKTVRRWVEAGRLPAERRGHAFAIRLEDAEAVYANTVPGRAARRIALGHQNAEARLDEAEAELAEMRGRYLELKERLVRVEAELRDERRHSARLEIRLEPAA